MTELNLIIGVIAPWRLLIEGRTSGVASQGSLIEGRVSLGLVDVYEHSGPL